MSACAEARSRPNGFSTITRAPWVQSALASCSTTVPNSDRRDGEVVRRPLRRTELLADGLEGCRIVVVAVDVAQQTGQLLERRRIDAAAVLLEAVARPRLELVELPAGLGHADHGHVEVAPLEHRLQRRERSSCRPDRRWRRRTPVRRIGVRSCSSRLLYPGRIRSSSTSSFPRKREPRRLNFSWIPACAGMTVRHLPDFSRCPPNS